MPATVEFDRHRSTVTVEIRDITGDELLAAEMNPGQTAPEFLPENLFFRRLILAQFPRASNLLWVDRLAAYDVARPRIEYPRRVGSNLTPDPFPSREGGEKATPSDLTPSPPFLGGKGEQTGGRLIW
jgi:hypothetical protein